MHKHMHLILKSHNLGHLEIYTFYRNRIWKEGRRKRDVFLRMSHSHDRVLC